MTISTHVLDTSIGRPAPAVDVRVAVQRDGAWAEIARTATDHDGRVTRLLPLSADLSPGAYRLTFDIGAYFRARGVESFYSSVTVEFVIRDSESHYHVPLLVSPFGYSTYRGS